MHVHAGAYVLASWGASLRQRSHGKHTDSSASWQHGWRPVTPSDFRRCIGSSRVAYRSTAMASSITAARLVVRELLDASTQRELLACRRTLVAAGPAASQRKQELVIELTHFCEDVERRRRICNVLLAGHAITELRSLITQLRRLGCLVKVGPRPKRDDLVAAIIGVDAYVTKSGQCKRASASSGSATEIGTRNTEKTTADWLRRGDDFSSSAGEDDHTEPGVSTMPEPSMALVAFDSSADPGRLQMKLNKRWRKRWAKFCKKGRRKESLGRLKSVLQDTVHEHEGLPTTVDELRTIVGHKLGIALQGKDLATFYTMLFKLTAPPPKKTRTRRRFKVADCLRKRARAKG